MKIFEVSNAGKDGTSGGNGSSGMSAAFGARGGNGQDGDSGKNGADAGNVNISLQFNAEAVTVSYQAKAGGEYKIPSTELSQTSIHLNAKGGNGGTGGAGGGGGNGGMGMAGASATQYSTGMNGGPGGNGGNGGQGGAGGKGGDSGQITVEVSADNTDLLMLVDKATIGPAKGGAGGHGGQGGRGGMGGAGGAGYSWTEYKTEYYTQYSGNRSYQASRQVGVSRHNRGGVNGVSGISGYSGSNGTDGKNGLSGKYSISVSDTGAKYQDRYNLYVEQFDHVISDDGIIEPKEPLQMTGLTVRNNGFMPTPTIQQPQIFLPSTAQVKSNGDVGQVPSIAANQTYQLLNPFAFSINPVLHLQANKVSIENVAIKFNAIVPRVNKPFTQVSAQTKTLEVRYPVEISLVSDVKSITRSEEAPFAITVRNISTQPLGSQAPVPREVKLSLKIEDETHKPNIAWKNKNASHTQPMATVVSESIALLAPNATYQFSGTLGFSNPSTPVYTNVKVVVNLELGDVSSPMLQKTLIQQSTSNLQLAETYEHHAGADFILVVNSNTAQAEIHQWMGVAQALGSPINIWNVSLYSGMDYHYSRPGGSSFFEEWKNKVVIVLDNAYTSNNQSKKATNYVSPYEIFQAASEANISTYVVGSDFKQPDVTLPKQDHPERTIVKNHISCLPPTENSLKKEAEKVRKKISKKHPNQQHVITYSYNAELQESQCVVQKWKLGTIMVREGLDATRGRIGAINKKQLEPVTTDVFNILKLLPFDKKLNYLTRGYKGPYKNIIVHAILSDLADEQYIYRQHGWSGEFPKDKLKLSLAFLNALHQYDTTLIFSDQDGKDLFQDLLLRYEYLVKKLPSMWDYTAFYRRGRILTSLSKDVVDDLLKKMGGDSVALTAAREKIKQEYANLSKEQLLLNYRQPVEYFNTTSLAGYTFNHWQPPSRVEKATGRNPIVTVRKEITEPQYNFSGPSSQPRREEAITRYENASKFTAPLPKLHQRSARPDHPDQLSNSNQFVGITVPA